jgi:hypothetical protein
MQMILYILIFSLLYIKCQQEYDVPVINVLDKFKNKNPKSLSDYKLNIFYLNKEAKEKGDGQLYQPILKDGKYKNPWNVEKANISFLNFFLFSKDKSNIPSDLDVSNRVIIERVKPSINVQIFVS